MRSFRTVICLLALAVLTPVNAADPIRAPGVPDASSDSLNYLVDQAIAVTRQRNLDFQVHTPWQILHGLLALRNNYTVKNGKEFVNALDYITTTARYKGDRWFERAEKGAKAHPYNGTPYDFEGHVNQSLAIIAMCDLPLTHQFTLADGSKATMADMVRHAQWAVTTKEETTWTLWFLTHYVDQDAQWTNFEGEQWSMERLVRVQNAASTYNAPCGGCHSLFALAYARNAYVQKHGKLQGAWLEADQKLNQYVTAAQSMMNRDGSFATQYFKARGFSYDFNERIASSGHMIEWLMLALPRKRLNEPWLRLGVQTLANDLIRNASQPADCGPLYHSLHALILYKQRMEMNTTPAAPAELATNSATKAGPVTSSTPDGESMPLSPEQMKEIHPHTASKPAVTASVEPKTVTPGTPATAEPKITPQPGSTSSTVEDTKPQPASQDTAQSLKPATTTQAPSLMAPSPSEAPALKPAQSAESSNVKKLSGSNAELNDVPQQADASASPEKDASEDATETLAPVKGGMPVYKSGQGPKEKSPSEKKFVEGSDGKTVTDAKAGKDQPAVDRAVDAAESDPPAADSHEPQRVTPPSQAREIDAKVEAANAAAQAVAQPQK